jgi:DNA adenine methylase
MNWKGSATTYKRIYDSKPNGELAKLYKFLYVTHFSYGRLRGRSFNPTAECVEANTIKRIENMLPRLKNVTVQGGE